jgi:hypothetical protein
MVTDINQTKNTRKKGQALMGAGLVILLGITYLLCWYDTLFPVLFSSAKPTINSYITDEGRCEISGIMGENGECLEAERSSSF